MLDQHEILIAEGIKSESLYLGPQALSSIPSLALKDTPAVLGLKRSQLKHCEIEAARTIAPIKQARRLVQRHRRNDKF